MTRRPPAPLWFLLTLVAACLGACAPPTLSRPAILGASASAGFGCETTVPPDGRAVLVDMEAVYNASVPGWHRDPVFLADASFYSRARQAAQEQMDAAVAAAPSVVIALDFLFWSVYHARSSELSGDAVLRDRLDALEQSLAQLDRFHGPILVGDIPDMTPAVGRMLSDRMVPPADQLATFNRRIREWAAARPADAPAVVVPVDSLARQIRAGGSVATSYDALSASDLMQGDHLHPTPLGLAAMLREGLHALAQRNLITPTDFRTDLRQVLSRLPAEAAAADDRREPGLWSLMALKGKLGEFGKAVENKDCAAASSLFDQIMQKVSRLKKSPDPLADLYTLFLLFGYKESCPDASAVIRRWRDRLVPEIERARPEPWPLMLWQQFNTMLDQDRLTIDRMLRLKREQPNATAAYGGALADAISSARYTDPQAYLALIPDWKTHLAGMVHNARQIAEYWTAQSKLDSWPKFTQDTFDRAARAQGEAGKGKLSARRAEFNEPRHYYAMARASTLEDMLCLEHALRVGSRTEEADAVRAALIAVADKDEIANAQKVFDKSLAEAQAKVPGN